MKSPQYWLWSIIYLCLLIYCSGNIFFWDTIQLGSKHASWYYENNFDIFFLPDKWDSGHIPAFGMYLALVWKVLGKSLLVSHLSMLPFVLGIIWQAHKLIVHLFPAHYRPWAMAIFCLDPTLLSQITLVSPDICLVFFFLLLINARSEKNRIFSIIACIGLVLCSNRGAIVAGIIMVVFSLSPIVNHQFNRKNLISGARSFSAILPAVAIFIIYHFAHFKSKGWIGYHNDSPWVESFQRVGFKDIIYNVGLVGWRLIDFGRVTYFIIILVLGVAFWKKYSKDSKVLKLGLLSVSLLIGISLVLVQYRYLVAHRYLLPAILITSLLAVKLIELSKFKEKIKKGTMFLIVISLLTGSCIIYPRNIAQGWDASLAHLPYFELRKAAIIEIETRMISKDKIGSAFPNIAREKYISLNEDESKFQEKDLNKNAYFLYSNVFNDVNDLELKTLVNWGKIFELEQHGIVFILYKNIENSDQKEK